ncbi:MAG: PKD domain-containing protein [Chitinophagaceae bacterium]
MKKHFTVFVLMLAISFDIAAQNYDNIEFVENKGQWDSRVKFRGEVSNGAVFVRSTGFTILQHNPQDLAQIQVARHNGESPATTQRMPVPEKMTLRSHAWNVDFVNASPNMRVVPDKAVTTVNNYFIGNDPSKWGQGCQLFQAITLQEVYPNVDVRYYTYNGSLKYDIIARPGADISRIALKYDGVDKIQVKNKQLVLSTSLGEKVESYPYTYQGSAKGRTEVSAKYIVKDNIVKFDVKDYDRSSTLIIDPSLVFCSLSGSTANNWGFTATYGPDGSFFGGGIVFDGGSFPVSPGAFQTTFQNGDNEGGPPIDIGIIKLSADGSQRLYATYIGGNGNEQPHSLFSDAQGNLVITGRSSSSNYPGQLIGSGGGFDIVVTKLNATGSGLIGSKRIGGPQNDGVNIAAGRASLNSLQRNYGDDGRGEVILDGAGNIYIAGCTQSGGFPTTAGAFQRNFGGGNQDGVVMKFTPDVSVMTFASFLGGSGNDAAYVLKLAPSGDIFVAGGTASTDFPGNKSGTVGPNFTPGNTTDASIDGFVAQISNNGSSIIRSTYLGTNAADQVYGIQFDKHGFPYVTGQTEGAWPVQNAAYAEANGRQFIAKLEPDLSAYVYSTVFGKGSTRPDISITAFLVDRCENVYVSGWGANSQNDPYRSAGTTGLGVTPDAYRATTDGSDFYFFVLQRNAAGRLYASFFGQVNGNYGDHVDGGTSRFDPNGVIYQGVCANCEGGAAFPVTPGAWGQVNGALPRGCNLGMIKMAFNLAGVGASVGAAIGGVPNDTAGCVPLTVDFTDQVRNATEYIWNFGDGTGDVGPLPAATGYTQSHTFMNVGTYRVMLIAIDPNSCNERDTAYINIRVGDLKANMALGFDKVGACTALDYQFNNLSTTNPIRPFTDTSFIWDFGDGSPRVRAGLTPVPHTFPAPGSYTIQLILNDTTYCNNPEILDTVIRVAANVDALFETPPTGCAPYTAIFTNTSVGGVTFEWNFGDPASPDNTSTLVNPTHEFAVPGTYTITMVANDPNTCNRTDTMRYTIIVYDKPAANFTYTPIAPVVNTPNVFTNTSSANAVRFKWLFGDGDSLVTTSRSPVTHQYNATGTFNACLIAFNALDCTDTLCMEVSTIIVPALDVPNAFTPNSGDINSVVMPKGFGISKMRFIVYNRWGQKVFQTENRSQGWDGRVKGVVQPMDVYAYTLEVEFFDGTKASRKGDITLIR